MNLDIVQIENGKDLGLALSWVPKAANVLAVQLGSLEYALDFGVDKRFFLENPIQFQNESIKAHFVERLAYHQVNVADVLEVVDRFSSQLTFELGEETDNIKGMIR
jgi:hypothetical protein